MNRKPTTATEAQLKGSVGKTPHDVVVRYKQNRNWRYYPKEWIYRNIRIEGQNVLDFGCGTGEITTQLAMLGAKKVFAVDVNQKLLDQTRQRAEYDGVSDKCQFICGSIENLEPKPVDVLIAFAVLHHCFPLQNVMPSLLQWLKPGGTFVAVEPVTYVPWVERLRNISGVEGDPLDEGERKLNPTDLAYVTSGLTETRIIPFHLFGRLGRLYPGADKQLRSLDQVMLGIPGMQKLSGTALIVGNRPL